MNSLKCSTRIGRCDLTGWLLSVDADEQEGAVLWLLGDDGVRYRLSQPFPTTFYVGGESGDLRAASDYLSKLRSELRYAMTRRMDLYEGRQRVLAIQAANPVAQQRLFRNLQRQFKRLRFYDVNIPFSVRYGVSRGLFPTARCRAQLDEHGCLLNLHALDSPWDIEYELPPLRVMAIEPDVEPQHAPPNRLEITMGAEHVLLRMGEPVTLLEELTNLLDTYDPDLILAHWGDGWLFPTLLKWAHQYNVPFNPNRDRNCQMLVKNELTYQSYGSVHYRASQVCLFGRWHIDPYNAPMTSGFSMSAAIDLARMTRLPVQTTARNSPGAGFTAMQIGEALRRGILVPLHKRQTEAMKSALELSLVDNGGLNYRPLVGLHSHVAILDYFAMYASLMAQNNISGEMVGVEGEMNRSIPRTHKPINQDAPGLVASVLKPLLAKRLAIKRRLTTIGQDDPCRPILQSSADAIKWLCYVSFGYQGFIHNLFGNIQAHEAITAYGREMLTRAKECAHDLGYIVLAANTDSLFVQKPGVKQPEHFNDLIMEIERRTGLVIMLQDLFDWLVFPPAKGNPRVGASNRYFGKLSDGGVKVRGLSQRRADTPKWVRQTEQDIIQLLASEREAEKLKILLPEAVGIVRDRVERLYREVIPLDELVVTNRLSREVDRYKGFSAPAEAAQQLRVAGKSVKVGQMIGFIYVLGERPGAQAWDLPYQPAYAQIDKRRYCRLLLHAICQVLLPLGVSEEDLYPLATQGVRQLELWNMTEKPKYEIGSILPDERNLAENLFGRFIRSPSNVRRQGKS